MQTFTECRSTFVFSLIVKNVLELTENILRSHGFYQKFLFLLNMVIGLPKCSKKLREQAYISLIRSRLECCAAVWDPYLNKDINILEGIQRRAARFVIQDQSRFTSVSSLLKDLNWAPPEDRRRDIRLAMLFTIVKCNMPVQVEIILLPPDPRTKYHLIFKFRHILSHTAQYKHSFFVITVPEWNSLPEVCVSADTVTAFRPQLRQTP